MRGPDCGASARVFLPSRWWHLALPLALATSRRFHITVTESNDPTASGPKGQDRMAKVRAAKAAKKQETDRISALEAHIAKLQEQLDKAPVISEEYVRPGPVAKPGQQPGEYIEDGRDPSTGRVVYRKRRWSRAQIEQRYPPTTFTPMLTNTYKPHGVTKGWTIEYGKQITVPCIVKDMHDDQLKAIQMQTEGYPGFSDTQERAAFEATRKQKAPHFSPVKHVDFGWPEAALAAQAKMNAGAAAIDPSSVGHEPEVGFPGGFNGKPFPEATKI